MVTLHHGQHVCQHTFLFFKNIKKSYLTNGPAVRVHGNIGKRPKHHLTLQQIKDIVQYILNYTGTRSTCIHRGVDMILKGGELNIERNVCAIF